RIATWARTRIHAEAQIFQFCIKHSFWDHEISGGLGRAGSRMTSSSVQTGPKSRDAAHHPRPLRPLPWARPALINDRVNHPTAYPAEWNPNTAMIGVAIIY